MLYTFFWLIHRFWSLIANVPEHSVCSIFIGEWVWNQEAQYMFSAYLNFRLYN
jgi:hypothetical protein